MLIKRLDGELHSVIVTNPEALTAARTLDAERLGVSRTPVKDAFARLEQEGLVSVVPRRGTFVSAIEVKDIDEILAIKHLLYDEGYKIAGAVKMRRQQKKAAPDSPTADQIALDFSGMTEAERLAFVKDELKDILKAVKDADKLGREVANLSMQIAREQENRFVEGCVLQFCAAQ